MPSQSKTRTLVLIDGDHHPAAVRQALDELQAEITLAGVIFCGGQEKLGPDVLARSEEHYGHRVTVGLTPEAALRELAGGAEAVLDLGDEPVLDPARRFALASVALGLGLSYHGPDFRLLPPAFAPVPFTGRTLALIGTGKRTGKTAVGVHWARLLREHGARPVVVAMGRGGPDEPTRAGPEIGLEELLEISRSGRHAASDYLEHAALAHVPAVGCRRVGGGLAGTCGRSNVLEGARLAATMNPGTILFEGSGSALPPVATDRTVCVVGSRSGALDYLGPYRLARADLVVLMATDADRAEIERWSRGPVIPAVLEPEPVEPVPDDARVAFFTTGSGAPAGIAPVVVSRNLARRPALSDDLRRAEAEGCDVYLTELKAAAVDTVAEAAERAGARLVWIRNRPRERPGEPSLDAALLALADGAG